MKKARIYRAFLFCGTVLLAAFQVTQRIPATLRAHVERHDLAVRRVDVDWVRLLAVDPRLELHCRASARRQAAALARDEPILAFAIGHDVLPFRSIEIPF